MGVGAWGGHKLKKLNLSKIKKILLDFPLIEFLNHISNFSSVGQCVRVSKRNFKNISYIQSGMLDSQRYPLNLYLSNNEKKIVNIRIF